MTKVGGTSVESVERYEVVARITTSVLHQAVLVAGSVLSAEAPRGAVAGCVGL